MTKSENGVVEEVFLSILNDKIKSTGKKKKDGEEEQQIELKYHPDTRQTQFHLSLYKHCFKTEVKIKVYMHAYQKHKRSCQSSWITRVYVPKSKCKIWLW